MWRIEDLKTYIQIPSYVRILRNGEHIEEDIDMSWNNFKIYVWQMFRDSWDYDRDRKRIYSEDFFEWIIKDITKRIKRWEKIKIIVGTPLSEIINWEGEFWLSFDEQIKYLNELIRKKFKKRKNDIEIVDIRDEHEELFENIKELQKDENDFSEVSLNADFTSYDIAKVLYQAKNKNSWFKKKLESLSPKWKDKSWTYWLCEIAIRIYDLLKWINIQWWHARQNQYDELINEIIFWDKYKELKEIKEIKDLATRKWVENFYSYHFDTSKYRENRDTKRIAKIFWAIALSVSLIVWWQVYNNREQYEEYEKQFELAWDQSLLRMLQTWPIFSDTTDNRMYKNPIRTYDTPQKQLEKLKEIAEWIVDMFKSIYWEWDNINNNHLYRLMTQTLASSRDYLQRNSNFSHTNWWVKFITEVFIPKNRVILWWMWFQIDSTLGIFEEYRETLLNTLKLKWTSNNYDEINSNIVSPIWRLRNYPILDYDLWIINCSEIIDWCQGRIIVAKYSTDDKYYISFWISVSEIIFSLWKQN